MKIRGISVKFEVSGLGANAKLLHVLARVWPQRAKKRAELRPAVPRSLYLRQVGQCSTFHVTG